MALGAKPVHTIVINFRDNDGATASCEILVPGATTPANVATFAAAIVPLVVPLSSAVVTGYNIILGFVESAIGSIGESDVEDKGVILSNAANAIKSSIAIPSFLNDLLQSNNRDIDQAHADVDAFLTALTAGLSGVQPCNASGSDLNGIRDAYKQNRQSHVSGRTRRG